ncbi:MAG: TIGR00282 family metallophosphoesterase, partial [bacterium]
MRILFVGDIFGRPGRAMAKLAIPLIRERESIDLVVANAENAAGGNGLTVKVVEELYSARIDCLTSGNHHWDKKEILDYEEESGKLLRPLNYPPGTPGHGSALLHLGSGRNCAVLSLVGRLFMRYVDCPFRVAQEEIRRMKESTCAILVDFHAEATSEKQAFAYFLDGKVSAVLGTHTHVQTADERILPNGTAYITDVGMTGPFDSVIGVRKDQAIQRFITQIPERFEVAKRDVRMDGVILDLSDDGKARSIRRFEIHRDEVAH